jgi:hypothetical protein
MDTPIQDLLFYEKYYLVMFGMFTIVYYKSNSFFGYLRNRSTSPNTNICVQNPAMFHLTFPTTITRFSMVKEIGHAKPPFSCTIS